MIVAIGVDVDDTFATFVRVAVSTGTPIRLVNIRAAVTGDWRFDLPPTDGAKLFHADGDIVLDPNDSYFCRLIDLSAASDLASAGRWRALLAALRAWIEAVPGRVVNRPLGGVHNGSKPLHEALLLGAGLRVPPSLTSSDPAELRAFAREGLTISKTVCGTRAHTATVTPDDFTDFDPESGPVHLQRQIVGDDARIHVVGEHVIMHVALAGAVDYRRAGAIRTMTQREPPAALKDALIAATPMIGLAFAGWDFKIDADGTYWCLEANPMPGYGPYDAICDGAISRSLLKYLEHAS